MNHALEQPLGGSRVLVVRPRSRGAEFAAEVAARGGHPVIAPLTRMVKAEPALIARSLACLDRAPDWIVFSSVTAVEFLSAALEIAGRDLGLISSAKLACVGDATARAAAALGFAIELVPKLQSSAGLAAELLKTTPRPTRVAVVRAHGGRDDGERILEAESIETYTMELYRSESVDLTEPDLANALAELAAGQIDVVPFFAPSQVNALFSLAGKKPLARVLVVAAVGKTTADALHRHGADVDLIASRPDPATFAAEIASVYQARRGRNDKSHP